MNSKTKRYECDKCDNPCILEVKQDSKSPCQCPYMNTVITCITPDWQEVPDEEAGEVATPEFKLSDKRYTHEELKTAYNNGFRDACDVNRENAIKDDIQTSAPDNTLILHYEFKPCPFCGRKPTILIDRDGDPNVGCSECACDVTIENHGIRPIGDKLRELQDRWNKRA